MRVAHRAALPVDPPPVDAGAGAPYDPAAHTVAEVLAYAAEHPDQVDAIRAAELAGKNRSSLLGAL